MQLLLSLSLSAALAAPPAEGLAVMREAGCLGCHSVDGTPGPAPTLSGRYGGEARVLRDEQVELVQIDADYLRRALRQPDADQVEGYPLGAMPAYALAEADERAVLEAIEALGGETPAAEGSMASLVAAALAFVVAHLVMSSLPLRTRLVARWGSVRFQGGYSLIISALLAWLVLAWLDAPWVPVWSAPPWTRYVPLALMPLSFTLMIAGYTTKSPTVGGQEGALEDAEPARGVLRITRHPANWGNALWGACHLFPNGDLAEIVLFGAFITLSLAGSAHIDRRRAATHPEAWSRYAARTSLLPFAAILQGRNRLVLRELKAWHLLAGLASYGLSLWLHTWLIGASPLP